MKFKLSNKLPMQKLNLILSIRVVLMSITILTTLSACVKKEKVSVAGYVINDKTKMPFNPYPNATIRLVDDQGYGYSEELGRCTVESDGSFFITTKVKEGIEARLELAIDDNWQHNIYGTVTLNKFSIYHFIIPCDSKLERVFLGQSAFSADSIMINISNSKGTVRYQSLHKGFNYFQFSGFLVSDENNYIETYFYENGSHLLKMDTVNLGCGTTLTHTVVF